MRIENGDRGFFGNRRTITALMFLLWVLCWSAPAAPKISAHTGRIDIPTYGWAAVKHPYFRGTDKVNIYPYPMLDFLSREKTNRTYKTVVLENEYLRITFLPELGGKIHEVIDKTTGRPMFYVNHVVKPGLIGQCGAWTSGGVEWNTGPQGHTVSCMQPVPVEILPAEADGSRSVAVGETERIYGTKWTVVVTLRPGRSFIEERIRIYNPTERIRPYYFWNCTASPNTPGFRFIYPMTLGMDHSGEKFFQWPVDQGKDLSRGTNYQDASSIFAYHCDQDFFGSYNDDLDRGVVSYANHYQLPGKKAWTWGYGGFGKMHQMDLTDEDGAYNEVQTGPLLTQGEVGRLDPCEAVEWNEWWYPIHALGGFSFANKDLAVNTVREGSKLTLRILGTGTWSPVELTLPRGPGAKGESRGSLRISPSHPAVFSISLTAAESAREPLEVCFSHGARLLGRFSVPLQLPKRVPPEKKAEPQTAAEFAQAGWQDFLFARFAEAKEKFRKALEKDSAMAAAHTGLACLEPWPELPAAAPEAQRAIADDPDFGLGHFALALAGFAGRDRTLALDHAWEAALDPATAAAGRALVARVLLCDSNFTAAAQALSGSGPWETDPLCQNRLAFSLVSLGLKSNASALAARNLQTDPLDDFAGSILWLAGAEPKDNPWRERLRHDPLALLNLLAQYADIGQQHIVRALVAEFAPQEGAPTNPFVSYWGSVCGVSVANHRAGFSAAQTMFPHWPELIPVFESRLKTNPQDAQAVLYLGELLFHLGRFSEGRAQWKRAVELGADRAIACRALGMAARTLDNNLEEARQWLQEANQADSKDAIVARDLANVLFALGDKADSEAQKRDLTTQARECLRVAFASGRGRSDFVALLARAHNRLGEFGEAAQMLDQVRVTVWEGAHEVHDLYEQAHVALGDAHLKAGRAAEALAEFNRALEYPANLATGKLENAREAHIQFQRGNALAALGRKLEAMAAWRAAANEPASKDSKVEEGRQKAKEALEKLSSGT